jgi:outer membrane protein OmpA-like peptidoglycan-associated protein
MTSNQALTRGALTALALVMTLGTVGCGVAATPKQLLEARSAYAAAASGPAGTLTPAELVDAKQALDVAERRFEHDGATGQTFDAAYVAERRAQIANARGRIAEAEAAQVRGTAELARVRAGRLSAAENDLAASRGDVARAGRELAATSAELRATGRALTEERKGRAEAERRMKDAMDKLALAGALAVREEPRGTVITLPSSILFATARWELLPGAKSRLDAVAVALQDQPDVSIVVEGHTDSQGTSASNLDLATKRAGSVRAYLTSHGVPQEQLSSVGLGEERPIGDNATTDGRSQNRRVEIIVAPREKR